MSEKGDIIDRANDRAQRDLETLIDQIRASAATITAGTPGVCDLCGEWSRRLVQGVCAACRDKYRLP